MHVPVDLHLVLKDYVSCILTTKSDFLFTYMQVEEKNGISAVRQSILFVKRELENSILIYWLYTYELS